MLQAAGQRLASTHRPTSGAAFLYAQARTVQSAMGYFRFRRTVKILPGIRLNLSRSGVSTSIGVRGAHVTLGHGKVRTTVGLPGSGLSYSHVEKAVGCCQPIESICGKVAAGQGCK